MAYAARPGDTGAVPVYAAMWLFSSGLLVLLIAGYQGQMRDNGAIDKIASSSVPRIRKKVMYMKLEGNRSWIAFLALSFPAMLLPMQLQAGDSIEGNIENGKAIAEKKCDRCHGSEGVSDDPDTPHLAGQSAAYSVKQLVDYKSRARDDLNMYKRAKRLDEQQMADIALWYESRPLPEIRPLAEQDLDVPEIVETGDPARGITPCTICHGKDGKNVAGGIPVLAGQVVEYLVYTMENFKDGSRSNDPGGAVQAIIKKLTDVEIEALARYYAALGGRPAE